MRKTHALVQVAIALLDDLTDDSRLALGAVLQQARTDARVTNLNWRFA